MLPRVASKKPMHSPWSTLVALARQHPRYLNCLAHWGFTEGGGTQVYDWSGIGNVGTLVGSPPWVGSPYGLAVDFDGTAAQYLTVPDSTMWNFGTGNFALSCWASIDDFASGGHLVSKSDAASQHQFALELDPFGDANDYLMISYGTTTSTPYLISPANPITDTLWHHLLGQRVGNAFEIWMDGVLKASGTTAGVHGAMRDGTTSLRVAGLQHASLAYVDGRFADVRIYNRALAAPEVQSLYHEPWAELAWVARKLDPEETLVSIPAAVVAPLPMMHQYRQRRVS